MKWIGILCFFGFSLGIKAQTNFTELSQLAEMEKKSKSALLATQATDAGKNLDVHHYDCHWKINPQVASISGWVSISFSTTDTASFASFDFNSSGMSLDSVRWNQTTLSTNWSGKILKVLFPQILPENSQHQVHIYYHGTPANSGFGSFNKQMHAGVPIIWTMSCPYAAGDWWPCISNLKDKADSIDLWIQTPSGTRAAGNGLLVEEISIGTDKIWHWKHKYPIAAYLVATAVTNYAAYTQKVQLPSQLPGDSLPVVNYVYPEILSAATNNTKKVLPILQYYDSLVAPYPFRKEKYGHAQFGWGGGMEHQTMSFMTDFSFNLQAHELAHQWFGDHITCGSWKDVWLNEGWATYLAALSEKRFGTANFQTWLNSSQNQVRASSGGSVSVSDTTDINRIFDYRLTYLKGALVLHMLRWELGDQAFWTGVRNYQADPSLSFGFASTSRFIQHLEAASGRDLQGFMADWFTGQGYPIVAVKLVKDGNQMELTLSQTSSHVSVPFFELKVPIRFRATGFDTVLIFNHFENNQIFNFTLPFSPATVTFDPDKWLLAKNTVSILTGRLESTLNPGIRLFPNPIRTDLSLENENAEPLDVQIANPQGQIIESLKLPGGICQKLNLEFFPAGIYSVRVQSGNRVRLFRMVKE